MWTDLVAGTGILAALSTVVGVLFREVIRSKDQVIEYWKQRCLTVEARVEQTYASTMEKSESMEDRLLEAREQLTVMKGEALSYQKRITELEERLKPPSGSAR